MSTHARIGMGLIAFGLCLSVLGKAQGLTEREAIRLFYATSPHTEEARAGTAVIEARSKIRVSQPNPQIGYEHEGAALAQKFGIEQTLPLNGSNGFLMRSGAAAVRADRTHAAYRMWELCSDMRGAFYDLLAAQQRERALRASMDRLQEILRILGERERLGEGSTFDRLRAERERANLQADITATRSVSAQANARLQSFLGEAAGFMNLTLRGTISTSPLPVELPTLLQTALEQRGDLQSESELQEQFQWEERATRRDRIPNPAVYAGIAKEEDSGGIRYGPHLAVSATIPLFDRGQYRIAELHAERRLSTSRQQVIRQKIQSEVRGAYEELAALRLMAEAYREQSESEGAQLERIANAAYQEGEIGILELLDSYRVTRDSELRLMELTAAAKQAEIRLERLVGKPVLNPEVMP